MRRWDSERWPAKLPREHDLMSSLPWIPLATSTGIAVQEASWQAASLPWLLIATLLTLAVVAVCSVLVLRKLDELYNRFDRLDQLEDIRAGVQQVADEHGNLDLRRVEHALLDIRDGQRRMEDRLIQTVEALRARAPEPVEATQEGSARMIADRVFGRLISLGYEQINLVTPIEELEELAEASQTGEILVEARRNGAQCKGRVNIQDGVILDVELRSIYSAFP